MLSVTVAAVVWRRRGQPGAAPFALLMLAAGEWAGLALLEHAALAPGTKVVFAALEYPGIMAVAPPWLGTALYLSGVGVLGGADPTPLAFALTGVVFAAGLFRRRLFDLVPVARHALIESMADGVLVLDAEHRVLDINPSARALLGLSSAPIGARAEVVLAAWPAVVALAVGGEATETDAQGETPTGPRELHARIMPLRDAGGRSRGRLLVLGDVTERRRTEDALRQSEKLASLAQLLAGVAHELNNPLSVVIGHATLLRRELGNAPGAARVERIAAAAERCARIVTNFLSVARRRAPERASTDVNRVLREAVALLAYQLELDNVTVLFDLGADLPLIRADGHQLQQVVINLVANAQQAMGEHEGSRQLLVTSRLDAGRGRVTFSIADTGPGIPIALRSRVFEPFFTTKPVGIGSGLGLSACRGIVEAHEGVIEIGDRPGGGAVVRVELPVGEPPTSAAATGPVVEAELIRGQRILVVDDEPTVGDLLREMLEADGQRVEVAAHGKAALDRLAEAPFDLVISDFKMPLLDGAGLYSQLAMREPRLRERFIFLSGDTLSAETRRFIERSGVPILEKPFDAAGVRRLVQRLLRRA